MALLELKELTVHLHREASPASQVPHVPLVRALSLSLEAGETLCIVGESGSGKTVTAMSVMRLLEFTAPVHTSGSIALAGVDLTQLSPVQMQGWRGTRIGMIFQEALESLNPSQRIGAQLIEGYRPARSASAAATAGSLARRLGSAWRAEALEQARRLLREVMLNDTERMLELYPHQLSGGMQQRVMIALALMSNPDLLIADEPTTALDVTTQAEILTLFRRVQREHKTACIFITHDMAVASQIADRIAVVYAGRLVEVGPTQAILHQPQHRYTRALLACVPRIGVRQTSGLPCIEGSVPGPADELPGCRFAARCSFAIERCRTQEPPLTPGFESRAEAGANTGSGSSSNNTSGSEAACWNPGAGPVQVEPTAPEAAAAGAYDAGAPVLVVERVSKVFTSRTRALRRASVAAVDEVSLTLRRGEFFGLVGESGSGKTTLGRIVSALVAPTAGRISIGGHDWTASGLTGDNRDFRRRVQPVFQDPLSSLDPRHTVARIIAEPLKELGPLRGAALQARVATLLREVGLAESLLDKTPAQLSGGQRQRVAIARAIAPEPELIVADEPTSALDVSVQGQVINLLLELRRTRGLSFLFITHNLSLILSVADRVGVMQHGRLIEVGTPAAITKNPQHEYTRSLLAANPVLQRAPGGA